MVLTVEQLCLLLVYQPPIQSLPTLSWPKQEGAGDWLIGLIDWSTAVFLCLLLDLSLTFWKVRSPRHQSGQKQSKEHAIDIHFYQTYTNNNNNSNSIDRTREWGEEQDPNWVRLTAARALLIQLVIWTGLLLNNHWRFLLEFKDKDLLIAWLIVSWWPSRKRGIDTNQEGSKVRWHCGPLGWHDRHQRTQSLILSTFGRVKAAHLIKSRGFYKPLVTRVRVVFNSLLPCLGIPSAAPASGLICAARSINA